MSDILNGTLPMCPQAPVTAYALALTGSDVHPEPQWHQTDHVLVTELPEGLVLMDSRHGRMFSLNTTGRFVWQSLPATRSELHHLLQTEYHLDRDQAQRDVDALIDHLLQHQLIAERPFPS